MQEGIKRIAFDVTPKIHAQLKRAAKENGETLSHLLRDVLKEFIVGRNEGLGIPRSRKRKV